MENSRQFSGLFKRTRKMRGLWRWILWKRRRIWISLVVSLIYIVVGGAIAMQIGSRSEEFEE
jgi:hypothetical protein